MKIFKRVLVGLAVLLIILNLVLYVTGKRHYYKALVYTFADIDDLNLFEKREIAAGKGQPWKQSHDYNKTQKPAYLTRMLDSLRSVAFLVVKNDSICYEEYWDGYGKDSHSNSFSMAKTIVSVLVGIAEGEGKIKNINDPVVNYVPEFKGEGRENITIKHLLTMSAALDWDESYSSLFSVTTEAYYGTGLRTLALAQKPIGKPGIQFAYSSGNTQLLQLVLENATGKTLSTYCSEKLWKPMACETPAYWSLDNKDGVEKAYCCVYSNARDFARIGKLYLNGGKWDSTQVVPQAYVDASINRADLIGKDGSKIDHYGYSWWLLPDYKGHNIFYARGLNGQYIFVIRDLNIIAVRLGNKRGERKNNHVTDVYTYIDGVLDMYGK